METGFHEHRRYSSLLIEHASVHEFRSFCKLVAPPIESSQSVRLRNSRWRVRRFEYVTNRSFYPNHLDPAESKRRPAGFAHDFYFAHREALLSTGRPVTLIASPYIRLLDQLTTSIRANLSEVEAPQYLSVNMTGVYTAMAQSQSPTMNVTKVTMQMKGEPTLELVSLSGKNPLHSKLHAAIKEVAIPYSLRTEMVDPDAKSRINVDRHGNLWWFQVSEDRIAAALRFIDELDSMHALRRTRSRPLDRAELPEDEFP